MKLSQLLGDIHPHEIKGDTEREVFSLCYDSRKCDKNSLFVAIPGFSQDGHDYIDDALSRGASVIIYERCRDFPPHVTAVKVDDTRRALGILARNFYGDPSRELCLIGILGTNGKTTVTFLLESILTFAGFTVGVMGTIDYRYGGKSFPASHTTPEAPEYHRILREMVLNGVSHVISEVSSHAVDLHRVDTCSFDLGIFTNLSQDHLDYHQTMENYFQAKLRFFREILPKGKQFLAKSAIINGDDPWGRRILQETTLPSLTYGLDEKNEVRGEILSLDTAGTEILVSWGKEKLSLHSPLIGEFNVFNILAAVATSFVLEVDREAIRRGIGTLKGVPGRLEKVSLPHEPTVIVDYAHTPDALIKVLKSLAQCRKGRIITLFGCGGDRDRGKRPLMGEAATALSDVVVITSDNPRSEDPLDIISEIERGIRGWEKVSPEELYCRKMERNLYTVEPKRRAAIEMAISLALPQDIVLIAGKGHENYQIIGRERLPFDDRKVAREVLDTLYGL